MKQPVKAFIKHAYEGVKQRYQIRIEGDSWWLSADAMGMAWMVMASGKTVLKDNEAEAKRLMEKYDLRENLYELREVRREP